jgi:hypothetical protein
MAVTTQNSSEYEKMYGTTLDEVYPDEMHGKHRHAKFTCIQSGTGDAGSSFALAKLPAGRVTLLLPLSFAYVNWTTASALLDLGWDAYVNLSDGAAVAANAAGICNDIDVDAVGVRTFTTGALAAHLLTGYQVTFESREGVVIRATSPTAIVAGDDLCGFLTYVVD